MGLAQLLVIVSGVLFLPLGQAAADTLHEEAVERATRAVKAQLRDPSSAEFSNVRVRGNDVQMTVCGEVNARNAYGGYAGSMAFYVLVFDGAEVPTLATSDLLAENVDQVCNSI